MDGESFMEKIASLLIDENGTDLLAHVDYANFKMSHDPLCTLTALLFNNTPTGWCPVDFDGDQCFYHAAPDTKVTVPCGNGSDSSATRYCNKDGTWERPLYNGCDDEDPPMDIPLIHWTIMYYMYWFGYSISLVLLLTALIIFVRFKKLWCLRNIIHSNLILCFACQIICWCLYSGVGHEIMAKIYGIEEERFCHVAGTLIKYFIAASFFWMFVEGVYLFISVVYSFHTRRIRYWMCFLVGWGIPLILILIMVIIKLQTNAYHSCTSEFLVYLDYIFIAPVLLVLLLNVLILLMVMYVVVTKLQATVPVEATRYKKAIKALFILCPLLGVNYVFILIVPHEPLWVHITLFYAYTTMTSVQGFLVAILFCFRNNEVRLLMKKSLRRWRRLTKFGSQFTWRESMRSETPSMLLEYDTSSPGRPSRYSVQSNNGYNRSKQRRSCFEGVSPTPSTKLRHTALVMNADGAFHPFLPQSHTSLSKLVENGTKNNAQQSRRASNEKKRRKQYARKTSVTWSLQLYDKRPVKESSPSNSSTIVSKSSLKMPGRASRKTTTSTTLSVDEEVYVMDSQT